VVAPDRGERGLHPPEIDPSDRTDAVPRLQADSRYDARLGPSPTQRGHAESERRELTLSKSSPI
jgi:hypothetical protein